MGERRKFSRKVEGGTIRLGGRELRVSVDVEGYVVAPEKLTGQVTIEDVDPRPREAKANYLGQDVAPPISQTYNYTSIAKLVDRYETTKQGLADMSAERAARSGVRQTHVSIDVVPDVLTLWTDEASWHYNGTHKFFAREPDLWFSATIEETDAAVAELKRIVESIRSLETPSVHPSDHEDHQEWLEEEAERKQKKEDQRQQEAWDLMRYGPRERPREQERPREEVEEDYL